MFQVACASYVEAREYNNLEQRGRVGEETVQTGASGVSSEMF